MSKNEIVINSVPVLFEEKNNHYFSDSLSIAKVFNKIPKNINRKITKLDNYDDLIDRLKIEPIYYIDDSGRKQQKYLLDRDVHLFIIMGLTGREASKYKWAFIEAFNLMEKIIKNTPNITIDESIYGELSEANKLHARVKPVRAYYRSDKHDELSVLLGERKRLMNRLQGLFDETLNYKIQEIEFHIDLLKLDIDEDAKVRKLLNN